MTSDETSSTPDHSETLRATKLQPGGDGTEEEELTSRTTHTQCTKVKGDVASGIRLHVGKSCSSVVGYFLINITYQAETG